MASDDFARRFSLRPGNLMWLLGAGASASAGIPTAWDMIWEFKQQLYISQRRIAPKRVADLSNPAVRSEIQNFIESLDRFPPVDAPDEYAALFEAAYPSETDRRTYIQGKITGGKPSYGHVALAALLKAGHTQLIWTTNFDTLVADACAQAFGNTSSLTMVALDAPDLARDVINAGRWPAEVKLHGDFRSRRLKNTNDELRQQDAVLRDLLVGCSGRMGLIIAGYSGRDDSIMEALEEAFEKTDPFPNGLFWLHRMGQRPLPRVEKFLSQAKDSGVDGGLVEIDNFDETLRDLIRLVPNLDTTALDAFAKTREVWSAPPKPSGQKAFPVLRFNALPLETLPTVCRLVTCSIGGQSEVNEAVDQAGSSILAVRVRKGILAFGSDADVRSTFSSFAIEGFDLHALEPHRLRNDGQERSLVRRALIQALARQLGLSINRRYNTDLLAPLDPAAAQWQPLKDLVGPIVGSIPKISEVKWREGIGTRLDWADGRLWLLFESRTIFEGLTPANRAAATDFSRERTIRRYNKQLNELISFWSRLLSSNKVEQYALGITSGVDAVFKVGPDTAFSRRLKG